MKGVGRGAEVSMRSHKRQESVSVLVGASGEPVPKELSVSLPHGRRPGRLVAITNAMPPSSFFESFQDFQDRYVPMHLPFFHAGGEA